MDVSSVYRQPVPANVAPKRSDEAQQTQNRAARQDDTDLKKATQVTETKPPKPVVNSQGQTTGRIINTTA
ncbi:MAG: hypothetical protein ABIP34_04385 [Rhodoferax sp.]|uniref:hypothetical protein n=1 Tax=Rhodoferax sp. TaxID=50421 RepID=UPI0032645670